MTANVIIYERGDRVYTQNSLMADLNRLNIDPGGTLMVHFSYKEIGEVEGRADAVLDALAEYMSPGLLVLPTHTWLNVNLQNPVMDVLYTPTCVGTLPELFRLRPNVCRSLHPTHSLAALGKDAPRLISGEEYIDTPCGYGGVYYKLWERDAQILLVGVNFARNTFIHGIEDWDHAVGSLSEEKTDLYVINADGYRLHTPQYRHDSRLGSETFTKLEPDAIRQGIMTLGKLGMATTRLMRARPLREMVADILKSDPGYLTRH